MISLSETFESLIYTHDYLTLVGCFSVYMPSCHLAVTSFRFYRGLNLPTSEITPKSDLCLNFLQSPVFIHFTVLFLVILVPKFSNFKFKLFHLAQIWELHSGSLVSCLLHSLKSLMSHLRTYTENKCIREMLCSSACFCRYIS